MAERQTGSLLGGPAICESLNAGRKRYSERELEPGFPGWSSGTTEEIAGLALYLL